MGKPFPQIVIAMTASNAIAPGAVYIGRTKIGMAALRTGLSLASFADCMTRGPTQTASAFGARAMLETTVAGSLPKPLWLAETERLWPAWRLEGAALEAAKLDATILAIKLQEDAGIDIVSDGEQARVHFVHGFLANLDGIDFQRRQVIGIRADRYKAEVPTVTGPIRRKGSVHGAEARTARAHTSRKLKFTLPGPMTIVDTIADEHYRDRAELAHAFAAALNEEAHELEAIGVDVVQFDEPAFNVYMREVADWGIAALERAAQGLRCKRAVHICYGYGIKANVDWKASLGSQWRHYEETFPLIAQARSIRCRWNAGIRACRWR